MTTKVKKDITDNLIELIQLYDGITNKRRDEITAALKNPKTRVNADFNQISTFLKLVLGVEKFDELSRKYVFTETPSTTQRRRT